MFKFLKQLIIAILANLVMMVLVHIFWNKEVWGVVFLTLCITGIIASIIFLSVILWRERREKRKKEYSQKFTRIKLEREPVEPTIEQRMASLEKRVTKLEQRASGGALFGNGGS